MCIPEITFILRQSPISLLLTCVIETILICEHIYSIARYSCNNLLLFSMQACVVAMLYSHMDELLRISMADVEQIKKFQYELLSHVIVVCPAVLRTFSLK